AKAGLKVMVLEKRLEAGGGLATEEIALAGYYSNTHSIFHMMVDYAPPYQDLKMAEYDVDYIYPSLQVALPLLDGRCLGLYTDPKKTCESIARFSQKDAQTYSELHAKLKGYMSEFLGPATYVPPVPALEQAARLEETPMGKELMHYSEKSPRDIVFGLFENEVVRTMMLYLACHWGLHYDIEGVGYLALLYLDRATNYRLCRGGSHRVSQAMYKVIHENGGVVLGSKLIKRVIVDGGAAKGVELHDGTVFESNKAVMSSLDPHQTWFKLVGKDKLDKDFVESLEMWRWEKWSLMQMHSGIEEPGPKFKAAAGDSEIDKAYLYLLGCETPNDLINQWDAIERGELMDKPSFIASFPSVHDDLMCPAGHSVSLFSQMVPYDLKDGGAEKWYNLKFKEGLLDKYFGIVSEYAPNINNKTLMWGKVHTPIDFSNRFLDMVKGSIKQGEYHPLQMGYFRPNSECSTTRTPVKNLYMCGSSVHPGGLITFGPGYLGANAVAEDLGVAKWWKEPESVTRAKQAGLLPA
ncbi:MAG: NAD(P)/FAD-dependent oxidoreductase, partial [Chloroflexi bacterium]|nr:NAD(P)/FAD-dependent oxidoreductase [Chloroflexota bacterium]